MAKPRIFISSTYYDLKHVRGSLESFIESLGYEPVLSEKGGIAYNPETPLDESCYHEAQNSDIFVIIIGGRYGSPKSDTDKSINRENFYDRYESVTKMEYESALKKDIPIYILIEKSVKSEYETFKNNRDNSSIKYAHVDSINIFHFIDRIFKQNKNNPVKEFEKQIEIEEWLKLQWAGLFRDFIRNRKNKTEISSLTSQVNELSNINTTLKRYMEELISNNPNTNGEKLIEQEEERLKDSRIRKKLLENDFISDFIEISNHSLEDQIKAYTTSKTIKQLAEKYAKQGKENDNGKRLYDFWMKDESEWVRKNIEEVCNILEIPNFK